MLSPAAQLRRFCPRILRWELAKAVSAQPFRRSLTDLADEKVSFFDAAILIFSPLAGLRPSRCGVALTLNFPKPGSDTSAPARTRRRSALRSTPAVRSASTGLTNDRCGLSESLYHLKVTMPFYPFGADHRDRKRPTAAANMRRQPCPRCLL
jgi:hypothetical protein